MAGTPSPVARHEVARIENSLSLRMKLLVFAAVLVVVPGLLIGIIVQHNEQTSLERLIGQQLAREATHTSERIIALIEAERQTLRSFAHQDLMRDVRVEDIDKRVSVALATLRQGSRARVGFVVVADGRAVAASSPEWLGDPPDWAARSIPIVRSGDASSSAVDSRFDDASSPPAFVIATEVRDPDQPEHSLGHLVGAYDWSALTSPTQLVRRDLEAQGIPTDVLILRPGGEIGGGTPEAETRNHVHSIPWGDPLPESGESWDVRRERRLLVGRAALVGDLVGWQVVIVESLADALAPARALSFRLAVTLAIMLGIALLVATLAGRRVVEPLHELTQAIGGLSQSDSSSLRVPVRSNDEVGVLARTFNRMASELDDAQKELVEAARFALMGELAAGVAHELRTSLGVLRSSAQILGRSLPTDATEQEVELALLIRSEVDRLGRVVDDLLDLGRPRSLQLETTELESPIFRAAELVATQARDKSIELIKRPGHDVPSVRCDVELLYQVALNLLVNAIQALGSHGRVEVSTFRAEDGSAGFEVCDDGPGIDEALKRQIFDPFVTGRAGGVGLGLTFVQRVVYEHRGRVRFDSRPGGGTCFHVELPAEASE